MRKLVLLTLLFVLLSSTVFVVWLDVQPDPPRIEDLTIAPATPTCPGGSLSLSAVFVDIDRWTLRERSSTGDRDRGDGTPGSGYSSILQGMQVCPPSQLCFEAESSVGTTEACLDVPMRASGWLDRLIFEPACPEITFPSFRISDLDHEGRRVILTARNASPYTITLIHNGDDGSVVRERAAPGAPYSLFKDRPLHGRWAIEPEMSPDLCVREECRCRPAHLPLWVEPPPGVVWISPIEIQVSLRCATSANGCPYILVP